MSDSTGLVKTAVIVEDDDDIRRLLAQVLEAAGFATISVGNGIDGVAAVIAHQPLITTLDVGMPGIDGFEAARRIRERSDTYIIMLTGLEEEADVVLGLGAGADEYLVKPFRPRELRARIEALLRRPRVSNLPGELATRPDDGDPSARDGAPGFHRGRPAPQTDGLGRPTADGAPSSDTVWLVHRDLHLDTQSRLVRIAGDDLDLTRTEFDLLAALMESKRRVRSKADLTLALRGESYAPHAVVGDADKRAIEAHMTNLRRKLGDNPTNPLYIETVRGVGYRLTPEFAAF